MRLAALDIDHERDAAGVMLEAWIVQAMPLGQAAKGQTAVRVCGHRHLAPNLSGSSWAQGTTLARLRSASIPNSQREFQPASRIRVGGALRAPRPRSLL